MKRLKYIDQFCAGFARGDAISNEALILQDFLRRLGYRSEIYTQHFPDRDADRVHHYRDYHGSGDAILIYHHSFFSEFLHMLRSIPAMAMLVFHNMTPPGFVEPYSSAIAEQLVATRESLLQLRGRFVSHLADSDYNAQELRNLGYEDVAVMPVPIDIETNLDKPDLPPHLEYLNDGSTNLLFVGRVFPNKRHQDLIKAFYYFQKIIPRSRLIIVGAFHPGVRGYTAELFNLTRELGLGGSVVFTGMVDQSEIELYYRYSHAFLSMSEHEGFFVPLIECMLYDIPIVTFASSVIPETLGDCGVLFYEKDFPRIAELLALVVEDQGLREKILNQQRLRRSEFNLSRTLRPFSDALERLGVIHP